MIESVFARENYQLAKTLLDATALRHQLLAGNIANAETPGYKRVDLSPDFTTQLRNVVERGNPTDLQNVHASAAPDSSAQSVRPDGNNVQLDRELLEVNRNELEYDYLTEYASASLQRLRTAITGRTQ